MSILKILLILSKADFGLKIITGYDYRNEQRSSP